MSEFSQMCRESGRLLMHIATYARIGADDGVICQPEQEPMG